MLWQHPFWKESNYKIAVFFFLLMTLVGLSFSARIVVSVSNIMLVLAVFAFEKRKDRLLHAFTNKYFLSLLLLYFLQVVGVFYTSNASTGWKEVTEKAGIIAVPFFFCANGKISARAVRIIMAIFSSCLLIVSIYCIFYALNQFLKTGQSSFFFYHQLVSPVGHHAVFFSFFLFYVIIYWSGEIDKLPRRALLVCIPVAVFFLILIILLSSKLVLVAVVIFFIVFALHNRVRWRRAKLFPIICIAICLGILTLALISNPIKSRFVDLTQGNKLLFTENKFSPDIYFNGLQFRLLTWRYTYEILNEKKAWLLGVSPGDAQKDLNERYVEKKMYMGEEGHDKGFWNFNCHNVYLQTLLESGLVGLFFLILAIAFFWQWVARERSFNTVVFFSIMLIFGFTESVLSSQYTILLFVFFPLLSLNTSKTVINTVS